MLGARASRPQRAAGREDFLRLLYEALSRFALIAGGTPAVPVSAMPIEIMKLIAGLEKQRRLK